MKFGVNTWVWVSPITDENLKELIPHVAKLGFDWIELALEEIGTVDLKKAAEIIREHHLGVSICAAVGADRDLIHPDKVIQKNAVQYVKQCVNAVSTLGGAITGGPFYSAVGRVWQETAGEHEQEMDLLVSHLRPLSEYAGDHGVTICIEALNRFETSFINLTSQSVELVDRVAHPNCQVMIDTFHMNIEEQSIGDAIRLAGPRLRHVHSNENDRGTPGKGHFPWNEFAAALKDIHYDGTLVIESFTTDCKSIARAAAIWRSLAPSQDALAQDGVTFLRKLLS